MSAASPSVGFTLGPLTEVVSAAAFDEWVARASAGQRLRYAHGLIEPRGDAVWQDAQGLAQTGGFALSCEKRDGERHWYITRTAQALGGGSGALGRRARGVGGEALTSDGEPVAEAMMRMLRRHANFGLPCPSNAELARAAELPSGDAARYHLTKLVEVGAIQIENRGPCRRRILVTGIGPNGGGLWTGLTSVGSAAGK